MSEGRISFEDFSKIEMQVGEIITAENHPKADKLTVLQVKLGDETRQIVAGLRPYRPDNSSLVGAKIIVVTNLEPAKLRGVESNGMLLAVGGKEDQPFALLTVDRDVPSGLKVL